MDDSSHSRGNAFEEDVQALLEELARQHGTRVTVTKQPTVVLQNDETVRPDFHLIVELPYERSHYFIECQDRSIYSKSILHKIQHIRAKQPIKTFVFVHPSSVSPELDRAMNAEGVMHYALVEFREFLVGIDKSLAAMESIPRNENIRDRAMLSSVEPSPSLSRLPEFRSAILWAPESMPQTNLARDSPAASPIRRKKWWQFWK